MNHQFSLLAPNSIPQPRCPVVLLLDTSSSMAGEPINSLQEGLQTYFQEVMSDPFSRMSVETCIITYGGKVETSMPFTPSIDIESIEVPGLVATGFTPMGAAISLGIHHLQERRAFYRRNGISAYRPWMILMTDGQPNDEWEEAAARARAMADAGRLVYLGIGTGPEADMETLRRIVSSKWPPKPLAGLRFHEFFLWLSDSLRDITSSDPSESKSARSTSDWSFS